MRVVVLALTIVLAPAVALAGPGIVALLQGLRERDPFQPPI
jgi:hypothetical protein